MANSNTVRLQLDLNSELVQEIDQAMVDMRMTKKEEYINLSMTLLLWAVEQKRQGRQIAGMDELNKKYRTFSTPMLDRIIPIVTKRE